MKKPLVPPFQKMDPQGDRLPLDMPLNSDEVKYLCPKADERLRCKPWIVAMPAGKQGQALYALSNRSFTLVEEGHRVIVHPKFD